MNLTNVIDNNFFGESFALTKDYVLEIRDEILKNKYLYTFADWDNGSMPELVPEVMQVYWLELLQRCYIFSTTGFLRFCGWLDCIDAAIEHGNSYMFAAALRGFIESSADLSYTLAFGKGASSQSIKQSLEDSGNKPSESYFSIAQTLVENHTIIKLAISGELDKMIASPHLEEALIYGQYATKESVYGNDGVYTPRPIKTYISECGFGDDFYSKCYGELCKLVHPAKESLDLYVNNTNNILRIRSDDGRVAYKLAHEFSDDLCMLYEYSFNAAVIMMKVINKFEIPELTTKCADNLIYKDNRLWSRIEKILEGQIVG